MIGRRGEDGGGLGLGRAPAHQPRIRPRAGGQAQGVENDRLAGARLAGERGQARADGQVQGLDKHDVTDGEANQHGRKIAGNLPRLNRLGSVDPAGSFQPAGTPPLCSSSRP